MNEVFIIFSSLLLEEWRRRLNGKIAEGKKLKMPRWERR
jgi:hypothetical protein